MDTVSTRHRSWMMAQVRRKNTKPELVVRSVVHRLGFRFRLAQRQLPGSPDIVLKRHKKAILVHGCFWHQHADCKFAKRPKSNREYWNQKLNQNIDRDDRDLNLLIGLGWRVLVIWSCQTKETDPLTACLSRFLRT